MEIPIFHSCHLFIQEHVSNLRELKDHINHMKSQLPEELISSVEVNQSIAVS